MSTESTGDGLVDAVGVSEPGVAAQGAEPAATAVAEPAAAGTGADAPRAWDTISTSAWDATAPADENGEGGENEDGATVPAPGQMITAPGHAEAAGTADDPVTDGAAEAGESAEAPEAPEAGGARDSGEAAAPEEAEESDGWSSEVYGDHVADEAAEYDLALDYDEDAEYDEEYEYDEYEAEKAVEPRPAPRWHRVLLGMGALALSVVIVGGALAIVGHFTHGFKKSPTVVYKKSALFSLKTGDCFDPQGQSYSLIPCDSPHVAEVFATFTLGGSKWPGTAAVARDASGGCSSRLTGYLNPQLAISVSSTYVYPDSVAWQAGIRTVICEVRATSGELTGSVREASATEG